MSAAWGTVKSADNVNSWRFIRMWGYLTVGAAFMLFVASRLGITLF
jgi:hypothetical protein